jgi:DeoR/GlpR family transcriptional regulator of sugar metabolism
MTRRASAPRPESGAARRKTILRIIEQEQRVSGSVPSVEELAKILACSPDRIRHHLSKMTIPEPPLQRSLL